jgi:hypothetical protein
MHPSPEASKEVMIRRVTLDLTGLLPTPAEVRTFLQDESPDAYEHLVDRLLAKPTYGEERARHWLDYARYADTYGIHLDNSRDIWPYRDYVIRSFNSNKPFNQFTVEQIAGDLLPAKTIDPLIASGYVRLGGKRGRNPESCARIRPRGRRGLWRHFMASPWVVRFVTTTNTIRLLRRKISML